MFSERRDDLTVGQFFDSFMNKHNSKRFRPFNEGVILGILYWLMFMKVERTGSPGGPWGMGHRSDPSNDP